MRLLVDDTLLETNRLDSLLQDHLLRIDAGLTVLWLLLNALVSNGPHAILSAVFNKSYRPVRQISLAF